MAGSVVTVKVALTCPSFRVLSPLKMPWRLAVLDAIHRLTAQTRSAVFTRQQLIENELDEIVRQTSSVSERLQRVRWIESIKSLFLKVTSNELEMECIDCSLPLSFLSLLLAYHMSLDGRVLFSCSLS